MTHRKQIKKILQVAENIPCGLTGIKSLIQFSKEFPKYYIVNNKDKHSFSLSYLLKYLQRFAKRLIPFNAFSEHCGLTSVNVNKKKEDNFKERQFKMFNFICFSVTFLISLYLNIQIIDTAFAIFWLMQRDIYQFLEPFIYMTRQKCYIQLNPSHLHFDHFLNHRQRMVLYSALLNYIFFGVIIFGNLCRQSNRLSNSRRNAFSATIYFLHSPTIIYIINCLINCIINCSEINICIKNYCTCDQRLPTSLERFANQLVGLNQCSNYFPTNPLEDTINSPCPWTSNAIFFKSIKKWVIQSD